MVTGASSGIGLAVSRALAERGATVCMVVRDESRGARAADRVRERVPAADVRLVRADLASFDSLRRAVSEIVAATPRVALLVNCASSVSATRTLGPEGIETTWATNVLGYARLAVLLRDALAAAGDGHIVNVVSAFAGDLDLGDVEFVRRPYTAVAAYRQSKQAERMLTRVLARRFAADGIRVDAVHPGTFDTPLFRAVVAGEFVSTPPAMPIDDAASAVLTVVDARLGSSGSTGELWDQGRVRRCEFDDADREEALWRLLEPAVTRPAPPSLCERCRIEPGLADDPRGREEVSVVPKDRYVSHAQLERERERLWKRAWLLVGPVSELREPGDYVTFEIGAESVLVVRDSSGVQAFHNVCLHRGRRLVEPGRGRATSFVCGYHHWDWALDGSLRRLPLAETFRGAADTRLRSVSCEVRAGLVWICLAPRLEQSLDEFLGPVLPLLEAYRFEHYHVRQDLEASIACNWKVATDGNDTYHLRAVHPQLLPMLDDRAVRLAALGLHARTVIPMPTPSPGAPSGDKGLDEFVRHGLVDLGLDPAAFEREPRSVRAAMQRRLRERADSLGHDFTTLCDDQLTDSHNFFLFPNIVLNAFARHAVLIRHRPHPSDPGSMYFDQLSLDRVAANASPPPRPRRERFRWDAVTMTSERPVGPVTEQDFRNFVRVQEGLGSSGVAGPRFGDLEYLVRRMHETLDAFIADDQPPRGTPPRTPDRTP